MGIFHCYNTRVKPTLFSHLAHFFGVVIGHEKIALQPRSQIKQVLMVKFGMTIEPPPGLRVGRIDEEHGVFTLSVFPDDLEAIPFYELYSITNQRNFQDAALQGFRVPSRSNAFSVFALFNEAGPIGQNSPPIDTILDNGCKGSILKRSTCHLDGLTRTFNRKIESHYPVCQPLGIPIDDHAPDGGNIFVEFHHRNLTDEFLKRRRQAHDAAAGERFDEFNIGPTSLY